MGIDIRRNIEYARHDGAALLGDLYMPQEAGKYPALVAVHGGGWQLGTREMYSYTSDNNATTFLLSSGTEDDIVDRATQSMAFLTALKQARFYVRTLVMQGAGHFWMSDPIEEAGSVTGYLAPRLLRFLAEKL